jgi:hypothetical protein
VPFPIGSSQGMAALRLQATSHSPHNPALVMWNTSKHVISKSFICTWSQGRSQLHNALTVFHLLVNPSWIAWYLLDHFRHIHSW